MRITTFAAAACLGASVAAAEAVHGIAMHGAPALPSDFTALPYANPDAPQGGRIVYGEQGGFDSLHPYIVKGRSPWGMREHVFESLMARSWDEPFALYGLLAATIETPPDRSWVEFHLRPEAKFSDGAPVTIDDVLFSVETLKEKGRPNYASYFKKVKSVVRVGDDGVRFEFEAGDRELPLLIGLVPILPKHAWEGKDFTATTLEPLIGSGPYVVSEVDPGATIAFTKNPNYWGAGLAVNAGVNNFDQIVYRYYKSANAVWEAFTAGEIDQYRENDPVRWAEGYDFPDMKTGAVLRGEIAHGRASGMKGFVFNTRKPVFADRRVREALTLAFDYDWINRTLYGGGFKRICSYYCGSSLAFSGPAAGAELALLTPYKDQLPAGTLEAGYTPPATAGDGNNRTNLRAAAKLLKEAGWTIRDGKAVDAGGAPLEFEILSASLEDEKLATIFAKSVEPLGVTITVRSIDNAQFTQRKTDYDFDMIVNLWWLSLSPGNEQKIYWGSEAADSPGARNYMGMKDVAADAMIAALLSAESREDFEAAARALDRVLTAGRYVIPFGYNDADRFAWRAGLNKPERPALYGYRPEVWWRDQ